MTERRRRLRLLLLNIAVASASFAAVLAVCEMAARYIRPDLTVGHNERISFCTYDERLGWRNRPNVTGTFYHTRIVHNEHGQRDKPRTIKRSGSGARVMVIGDSFVWGYRVETPERFTDQLEAMLPGDEILNFGCSGYGQDQEYLLLQKELTRWVPDLVVVAVHVASDLENNIHSVQYGYNKPMFELGNERLVARNLPVPRDSPGTRLDRWMTARSALWNLIGQRKFNGVEIRTQIVAGLNRFGALGAEAPPGALVSKTPRAELTCRLCAAIRDLVNDTGPHVLFLLIPDIDTNTQAIRPGKDYDKLRDCLIARQLPTVDLEPVFRSYHEKNPRSQVTLAGDRHWSAEGNTLAARTLYEYLRAHPSLLERSSVNLDRKGDRKGDREAVTSD